jgi:tellurite resistance protein
MDLVVFRPEELPFVLGALRNVAASDSTISPGERALVEGIARIHGTTIDFDRIESTPPDRVASAVQDPHRRKRLVQLAIVAALAEGAPAPERETAVDALAKALEVSDTGVKVIRELSHGHTMFARFDVMRRMRNFMNTHDKRISFAEIVRTLGITENAELAARYRSLADCPADSFGRAFHSFYVEHGFGMPGEKHGIGEDFLFHDAGHVLSGYGVDPQGEIQQASFQAGYIRNDGFLFLLFGILQFHIGIRLTPIAKAEEGLFDVDRVLRALTRGAACKRDLSDHFDIFEWKDVPLQTMRAELGIPPL